MPTNAGQEGIYNATYLADFLPLRSTMRFVARAPVLLLRYTVRLEPSFRVVWRPVETHVEEGRGFFV